MINTLAVLRASKESRLVMANIWFLFVSKSGGRIQYLFLGEVILAVLYPFASALQ